MQVFVWKYAATLPTPRAECPLCAAAFTVGVHHCSPGDLLFLLSAIQVQREEGGNQPSLTGAVARPQVTPLTSAGVASVAVFFTGGWNLLLPLVALRRPVERARRCAGCT